MLRYWTSPNPYCRCSPPSPCHCRCKPGPRRKYRYASDMTKLDWPLFALVFVNVQGRYHRCIQSFVRSGHGANGRTDIPALDIAVAAAGFCREHHAYIESRSAIGVHGQAKEYVFEGCYFIRECRTPVGGCLSTMNSTLGICEVAGLLTNKSMSSACAMH